MPEIFKRTANVLTGKESKFASRIPPPMNLIIGFILSLIFSFITYTYLDKDDKKKGKSPIIPSIGVGILTMLMYNTSPTRPTLIFFLIFLFFSSLPDRMPSLIRKILSSRV